MRIVRSSTSAIQPIIRLHRTAGRDWRFELCAQIQPCNGRTQLHRCVERCVLSRTVDTNNTAISVSATVLVCSMVAGHLFGGSNRFVYSIQDCMHANNACGPHGTKYTAQFSLVQLSSAHNTTLAHKSGNNPRSGASLIKFCV